MILPNTFIEKAFQLKSMLIEKAFRLKALRIKTFSSTLQIHLLAFLSFHRIYWEVSQILMGKLYFTPIWTL